MINEGWEKPKQTHKKTKKEKVKSLLSKSQRNFLPSFQNEKKIYKKIYTTKTSNKNLLDHIMLSAT